MKNFLGILLIIGASAFAAPQIEVVLTAPVETDLSVPGVRESAPVWLEMINQAKSTIDIEQFYVSDESGKLLSPVLKAISAAAARGVTVRLLADAKFFKTYPESIRSLGNEGNAEARTIDFSVYGGVQHAKFFIVDGKDAYVGSANFDWRALEHIHEVGLRVTDEAVASNLQAVFEKDWAIGVAVVPGHVVPERAAPAVTKPQGDVYLVAAPVSANPQGIPYSGDAIVGLMKRAKKTLKMQVMTYSTKADAVFFDAANPAWTFLDSQIRAAAKRGVKVSFIVDADHIGKGKAELESLAKVKNVEVKGVTIPQWSGGKIDYARLVHSKYLVIDNEAAWVGTENWTRGYFMNTRDVGFVTTNLQAAEKLTQIHDKLWASQYAKNVK